MNCAQFHQSQSLAILLLLTVPFTLPAKEPEGASQPPPSISVTGSSKPVFQSTPVESPQRVPASVLAKLTRVRSRWPREVALVTQITINILGKDRAITLRTFEPGTVVVLENVTPTEVMVLVQGTGNPLLIEQCDLVERMGGVQAILALPDDSAATSFQVPSRK
jgi:hypothetical protein